MEAIIAVIFIAALPAVGVTYLRFCKRMSEDLIGTVKFCRKTETEGGDNWPGIEIEIGNFDKWDDLTESEIEKSGTLMRGKKEFVNGG